MWWMVGLALAVGEMPYDGVDQDGDGADLVDVDGDGYPSELAFGGDCNDRDDRVHPGAWDRDGDGVDADCDGADGGGTSWPWWPVVGLGLLAYGTSIRWKRHRAITADSPIISPSPRKPCQAQATDGR